MGTPKYMAPEQVEHPQQVDHRADIYSPGVVFYQMLTGELPVGRFAPPSERCRSTCGWTKSCSAPWKRSPNPLPASQRVEDPRRDNRHDAGRFHADRQASTDGGLAGRA